MNKLMGKVQKVLIESLDTPEEAVRFFLKKLVDGARSLSTHLPRHIDSKVLPMRVNVVESRLEEANLIIDKYNDYNIEMTLLWAEIMKKWVGNTTAKMKKIITKEISHFENDLTKYYDGANKAALEQSKNISFVLDNYTDLTEEEKNNLISARKRLIPVSKMNYDTFIKEILEKGEVEEA